MFQATPQRRFPVMQSRPQTELSKNFFAEGGGRQPALVVEDCAAQHLEHGKEDEQYDQAQHQGDRNRRRMHRPAHSRARRGHAPATEEMRWRSAALPSPCRAGRRRPARTRRQGCRRSSRDGRSGSPGRRQAQGRGCRPPPASFRRAHRGRHAETDRCKKQRQQDRQQPPAPAEAEPQRRREGVAEIPGQKSIPRPAREPDEQRAPVHGLNGSRPGAAAYFGNAFTSRSHFDSSRRRSSDEPYLAKS